MKISWTVVLLFAGLVLAQHHRHSPIEYAVSDEGHLGHLDYDTTGTELRQVVTSLKDLKSCLCKLITVQKKQIELELLRAQGSTVGAPNQEGKEIEKGLVGTPLFATEKPTPTNDLTVNQPQGASVDIKLTPTTVDPQSAKDSQTTETPRDKRQSSSHGSDFTEIAHDDFQKLIDRGFNFDEDSEAEKEFLAENPSSDVGAVSITTIPKNADRKTRKVKEESGPKEIEEAEEEVAEAIKPKKAMSEESSMETPTAPEHLTVSYDRMEKKKAMPTVSLPRKNSLEFPNGATYYDTGDQQKPIDYTLNIPQQTYYLVPGPVPGKNRIVAAPFGSYDQDPEVNQSPSKSLEAQYAPTISMDHGGQENGHPMMMNPAGYDGQMYGGQGGHVQYLPMEDEQEERQTEAPKEKRKRRRGRKKERKVVEVDSTASTAATPTAEVAVDKEE